MATLATAADPRVRDVRVNHEALSVELPVSVSIGEISSSGYSIHWPEIDEDLSTDGLLRGANAKRN
jgi:hypothetical protein